jgi:membrane-bound lytic murein transglycosylase A
MIAQDTGSAIVGPARADLYFGAGADAGRVSGRLRHTMRFAILVPKSLDPMARGRKMPLPDARPSAKIAKLFPPGDTLKDRPKDPKNSAKPSETSAAQSPQDTASAKEPAKSALATTAQAASAAVAKPVPLPEARPNIKPAREVRRHRYYRHYRGGR